MRMNTTCSLHSTPGGIRRVIPCATADSSEQRQDVSRPPPPPRRPLDQRRRSRPPSRQPRNGFFSDADPNGMWT